MENKFSKRLRSSIESHSVVQPSQISDANMLNKNVEVELDQDKVEINLVYFSLQKKIILVHSITDGLTPRREFLARPLT